MAVVKRWTRSLRSLRKIPRRGFGIVNTNCRCGTSKQRTRAIQSPVAHLPLMTTRTEVPRLAGEGEETLVAAVGTLQPGESCGEIAAAVELANDVDGGGAEGTVDGTVTGFVPGDKIGPAVVYELTPSMRSGFARFSCR